ncbi:GNAT family N-acetyltransferase [Nocardioides cynanchi]|uniref:GNAT family N-acetyltransferase n=1 Tax=Nocardioides cynanchi TaxID=2558918 RepID=UPI0012452B92|nr:GNAT family N-acetyltransferase [Nocardioides cynanchi]
MADLEIRVVRATDPDRYLASDLLIWFSEPVSDETAEALLLGVPEHQRFVVELPDADVDPRFHPGVYGVRPMQLSVPDGTGAGRLLPVAGLTWVGVHPDHRRRGLLTAMMRHHVEQTRSEGVHVSVLHASEPGIYGRHGYGLASLELSVDLGRGTTFVAPHLEDEAAALVTRMTSMSDEGMAERRRACELAVAPSCVGAIVGEPGFFADLTHVVPEDVRDKEVPRLLFAMQDGRDVGYALFRRTHKWDNARPGAVVDVHAHHATPAAHLALMRRLVDLDLAGTIKVTGVAQDDPMLSWIAGPRATGNLNTYDSLWVRLVDLPEALAARGYEADCDVVVEVADESAPWNAGRWRIRVEQGAAEATRTEDDAEVSLSIAALGAAYLGGGNLAAMRRAGLVAEHRPGAVSDLWRAFRTDVPPYASRGF